MPHENVGWLKTSQVNHRDEVYCRHPQADLLAGEADNNVMVGRRWRGVVGGEDCCIPASCGMSCWQAEYPPAIKKPVKNDRTLRCAFSARITTVGPEGVELIGGFRKCRALSW